MSRYASGEPAIPQVRNAHARFCRRVPRPHRSAVPCVQRIQDPGRSERIHAAPFEGRSRARARSGVRFPESDRIAVYPNRFARGQCVAGDDLVFAALLLRVEEFASNSERRQARPDRPSPQLDGGDSLQSVPIRSPATTPSRREPRKPGHAIPVAASAAEGETGTGALPPRAKNSASEVSDQRHANSALPSPVMPSLRTSSHGAHATKTAAAIVAVRLPPARRRPNAAQTTKARLKVGTA